MLFTPDRAHCSDIVVRQAGIPINFSSGTSNPATAFGHHVAKIIALGSYPEMFRIHAGWRVAGVQYSLGEIKWTMS